MTGIKIKNDEQACFVCGKNNNDGFKVDFTLEGDDRVFFMVKIPAKYQGYDGIVHGGLISTMLDEVMANCFFLRGIDCLTTEINVRFLKALPVDMEVKVVGEITKTSKKIGQAVGWLEDDSSVRYAEGSGKFYLLRTFDDFNRF